jgi:hypothetical protein
MCDGNTVNERPEPGTVIECPTCGHKTVEPYSWNDLCDSAQDTAKSNWYSGNCDYEWWEDTIQDCVTEFAKYGLHVSERKSGHFRNPTEKELQEIQRLQRDNPQALIASARQAIPKLPVYEPDICFDERGGTIFSVKISVNGFSWDDCLTRIAETWDDINNQHVPEISTGKRGITRIALHDSCREDIIKTFGEAWIDSQSNCIVLTKARILQLKSMVLQLMDAGFIDRDFIYFDSDSQEFDVCEYVSGEDIKHWVNEKFETTDITAYENRSEKYRATATRITLRMRLVIALITEVFGSVVSDLETLLQMEWDYLNSEECFLESFDHSERIWNVDGTLA